MIDIIIVMIYYYNDIIIFMYEFELEDLYIKEKIYFYVVVSYN